MHTNNHLPMLGSVRSGDAPGESSWDRQDFQRRLNVRSRSQRAFMDTARRALKRRERDELTAEVAAEVAAELDPAAELVAGVFVANWANRASTFSSTCDDWEAERAEADLLDEAGVNTFADLATIVAAEVADAAAEIAPSPWGDTFDPDDIQWGFSVRTRF